MAGGAARDIGMAGLNRRRRTPVEEHATKEGEEPVLITALAGTPTTSCATTAFGAGPRLCRQAPPQDWRGLGEEALEVGRTVLGLPVQRPAVGTAPRRGSQERIDMHLADMAHSARKGPVVRKRNLVSARQLSISWPDGYDRRPRAHKSTSFMHTMHRRTPMPSPRALKQCIRRR